MLRLRHKACSKARMPSVAPTSRLARAALVPFDAFAPFYLMQVQQGGARNQRQMAMALPWTKSRGPDRTSHSP